MLIGGGPVNESGPVNRGFMDLKKERKKFEYVCITVKKEKAKHLSLEFFSLGVLGPFAEFSVSL